MSDERKDFEFYVGGIEDGLMQVLRAAHGGADGYLKDIGTYSGELDEKTLKQFIDQLAPRFPLMLIAYGEGADELMPATSSAFGEPRIFRHDCTFGVICCDDNARGETERRRGDGSATAPGVIRMLSDTREDLGGLQLRKEGELLTLNPLTVAGVRYLARLPGLTAYIQDFDTYFKWTERDRRGATHAVEDLSFEVRSTSGTSEPGRLPGVIAK